MLSRYEYLIPQNMDEALSALSLKKEGIQIIAGGTDLVIRLREDSGPVGTLLDLRMIPELGQIEKKDDKMIIGSMVNFDEIANSPQIQEFFPALSEAARSVGSPQIRNTATMGGNIVNAAPAADSVPTLMALQARLRLVSTEGQREVSLEEFLVGLNETILRDGEILHSIEIPFAGNGTMAFAKIGRRKALAIARINVAVSMKLDAGNVITECRVALGAVGKTAYRSKVTEEYLTGKILEDAIIAEAMQLISDEVRTRLGSRPTAPYKSALAGAVLKRALCSMIESKNGGTCNE